MEGHADVCGLVERQDDALLQVEPVICAHGYPQQAQGAYSKHAAQQRQRLPATEAHNTASPAGGATGRKESCKRKKKIKNFLLLNKLKVQPDLTITNISMLPNL